MSDPIDRQLAIDVIRASMENNNHKDIKVAMAHEYEHRHCLKILYNLPSAQKKGKWVVGWVSWVCSECGFRIGKNITP